MAWGFLELLGELERLMVLAEWDHRSELLGMDIRMIHCGGRSDCIWAASHHTAR